MTEETPAATNSEQKTDVQFALQRIYLKDLSFESPQGVKAFTTQAKPKVNQELNTKTSKIEDNLYEVALRLTVTVADGEETLYLVEVEQAGLFAITGLQDQQLAQVLNTACPNILFPYAREAIDNTLTKATFPPLLLPPINFDALFASAVQQAQQQAQEKQQEPAATEH